MYTYVIIDDESLIRQGTEKKLSALAEQITCIGHADNGKDGISLIEKVHPDIAVLDMQMPIMDGTQLLPYLSEHYPDMPLIVISGYRDFDYINHAIKAKAIDYILKPFSREDIQKSMLDAIAKLEDNISFQNLLSSEEQAEHNYYEYDVQMLKNLILGYHTASASITSKKLSFINDTHNLVLLSLHFSRPVPKERMKSFIEENGFGDLALYLTHMNNQQLGFIVLFVPENTTLSNKQLSIQIAEALIPVMSEFEVIITVGISNTHKTLMELHSAFLETSDALNSQPLNSSGFHYYFSSEAKEPKFIHWDRQEEFLFRIEAGMPDEVSKLLDNLFQYYNGITDCTLADAKYHCYQLGDQCRMIMKEYLNQPAPETGSASMQNIVSHTFSAKELENYYRQFFLNITNMLKPQSVYAIDDIIEKIKIYINRNYQKNLTQDFISCLFYLNRSYLSQLFKAKTGQKFVDYLNGVRIQKAKELLGNSDRKMYQIAKAVGYDNVKYFFRVFKKYEGVTPEQYRGK